MAKRQTYADFHLRSLQDREAFWSEQAGLIDWHTPFKTVCDYDNPPFARWFVGGKTNLCHNAVATTPSTAMPSGTPSARR